MGNARQAIDLLRVGAETAERNGDQRLTGDHIERARTLVKRGRIQDKVSNQTHHAQLILETLAKLEESGAVPARSKEILTEYETVADAHGVTPLSTLKSVQDHLSDLHMLGFLVRHERNEGRSGGLYYEYELDLDPSIVLDVRRENPF